MDMSRLVALDHCIRMLKAEAQQIEGYRMTSADHWQVVRVLTQLRDELKATKTFDEHQSTSENKN